MAEAVPFQSKTGSKDRPSLRDLSDLFPPYPALKRWAIIGRPAGAQELIPIQ
jgi:hypothetical protein